MTADEFRSRLSAYLEGELGPAEKARMDRKVAECPECERLYREVAALCERVRDLPKMRPSASFDFALRSRLLMEASKRSLRDRVRGLLFPSPFRTALTGALAAAVALGVTATLRQASEVPAPPGSGPDAFRVTHGPPTPLDPVQALQVYGNLDAPTVPADPVDRGALTHLTEEESYALSGRLYRDAPDTALSSPRKVRRVTPAEAPADPARARRVQVSF